MIVLVSDLVVFLVDSLIQLFSCGVGVFAGLVTQMARLNLVVSL